MTSEKRGQRIQVRRHPERGSTDRSTINGILDEGFLCHVGYESGRGPVVLPTLYGRRGDSVYCHGSPAAGMFRHAAPNVDVCLTVTIVDGFVLARSLFHHSMNYRSVVVLGPAKRVSEPEEVMVGLEAVTENALPGRWGEARLPSETELRQTALFKLDLTESSSKMRTGPPGDEEADLALDVWAGVLPVSLRLGSPVPAADLRPGTGLTAAVENLQTSKHY